MFRTLAISALLATTLAITSKQDKANKRFVQIERPEAESNNFEKLMSEVKAEGVGSLKNILSGSDSRLAELEASLHLNSEVDLDLDLVDFAKDLE